MIWRIVVVAVVIGLAWVGVTAWETRGRRAGGLQPGITVVTGPFCRLCDAAVAALSNAGNRTLRILDVSETPNRGVRSLPAVFVVGPGGELLLHRSGRAAVSDAAEITRTAQEAGVA